MNLEQAIAILNTRRHRDFSDWYESVVHNSRKGNARETVVMGPELCGCYTVLTPFEVIAIAKEYQVPDHYRRLIRNVRTNKIVPRKPREKKGGDGID